MRIFALIHTSTRLAQALTVSATHTGWEAGKTPDHLDLCLLAAHTVTLLTVTPTRMGHIFLCHLPFLSLPDHLAAQIHDPGRNTWHVPNYSSQLTYQT